MDQKKATGRRQVAQHTNVSSGVSACMTIGQADTRMIKGKSTEVTSKITGAKGASSETQAPPMSYVQDSQPSKEELKDAAEENEREEAEKRYREMLQCQAEAKREAMEQQKAPEECGTGLQVGGMEGAVNPADKVKSAAKEMLMYNQQMAAQKASDKAMAKRIAQTPTAQQSESRAAESEMQQVPMMPPQEYAEKPLSAIEPKSQVVMTDEKAMKMDKARKLKEALEVQMKEDRARKLLEKQERSGFKKI